MSTNLDQWYLCGNKKYHNIWQAFDQNINDLVNGYKHIDYVIDKELIAVLQKIKKPRTDSTYIRSLIVKQLKSLRKKYNTIRFLYSGGTDSFTVLKLAIENDIFIDETITHLVSFTNNPRCNIEYLWGLKYAKEYEGTHIGKVNVINPNQEDIDYYHNEQWWLDQSIVRGSPLWLRGQNICKYLPATSNNSTVTITGCDKPTLYVDNKKIFWCIIDNPMSEYMGIDSIYHMFCDKNNPELIASQTYAFLNECLNLNNGFVNIDCFNDKRIDLIDKLGLYKTGKPYLDKALIGKKRFNMSLKNKNFLKELKNLNHRTLTAIYNSHLEIFNRYKKIPYGVQFKNNFVESVGRFSQKIPIYQDSFGS